MECCPALTPSPASPIQAQDGGGEIPFRRPSPIFVV